MDNYRLITKRRTIRKFKQKKITPKILFRCLNAARLAPSSANLQPLEYILVTENLSKVFNCTRWAGYLEEGAPKKDERPTAYIVIISSSKINRNAKYDVGFAAENIILTALEEGIGSCPIGSIDHKKIAKTLNIPKDYLIELMVALGYPKQGSIEEEFEDDIKYYLDKEGVLHVPKRGLKDIVHEERF